MYYTCMLKAKCTLRRVHYTSYIFKEFKYLLAINTGRQVHMVYIYELAIGTK